MDVFDQMTETIMLYVDKAVARLDARDQFNNNNEASDRSVLEKLLMIDRRIAIVMAFDMLLAGVDTVSGLKRIIFFSKKSAKNNVRCGLCFPFDFVLFRLQQRWLVVYIICPKIRTNRTD